MVQEQPDTTSSVTSAGAPPPAAILLQMMTGYWVSQAIYVAAKLGVAIELAPVRFNALHSGIIGDSPFWMGKPLDAVIKRTPTGRLVTMAEVVDATVFLLENAGMNGANLYIDGGWMLM